MSEWHVEIVRVGPMTKHENADSLSMTHVRGYPVIIRTGDFQEGELAVYVPVDSIVPASDLRWVFLDGHYRVKAKKLRGIFSMGLLTNADPSWVEGQDVSEVMGIVKYEPVEPFSLGGECEADPGYMPVYDIEGLRRWPNIILPGEEVCLTEKIHGSQSRFLWKDDRLWVGSHKTIKREDPKNLWWRVAYNYKLPEILSHLPNVALYAEAYGHKIQDMQYGAKPGEVRLRFFDAIDTDTYQWLNVEAFIRLMHELNLPMVPILCAGPWGEYLRSYADGISHVDGAQHYREGFVVRPVEERWDASIGRVILKYQSEEYLLKH